MKGFAKFLKWIFIIIILLIAVLFTIPFIFEGKIKEIAKEEISNNVDAQVEFGDISLSILSTFPNLKLSINDLTIIGANEFKKDTLANISQISLKISLLSVLDDPLTIRSIIIDQPNILAKVLKNEKANWDIAKESGEETITDEQEEGSAFQMNLQEFKIIQANIIYDDQALGVFSQIKNMNFVLSGDLSADFSSLNTSTQIEELSVIMDKIPYLNKTKVEANIYIDADLKNSIYTFKENSIGLNELHLGFDGSVTMKNTDIELDMTYEAKETEFKNILSLIPAVYMSDFSSLKTSGLLSLDGFAKGVYNDQRLPAFDFSLLVKDAQIQYPDLPASVDNIQVNMQVSNQDGIDDHTIVNIKKFHIDLESNPFDMTMLVKTPISDPSIDATVKGVIDLDKLKRAMPLDDMSLQGIIKADMEMKGSLSSIENEKYEDFHAKGNMEISNLKYNSSSLADEFHIKNANLVLSPQFMELKSFNSSIGKSDIQMKGKIENMLSYYFKDELLKGNFVFTSELLDLNELMGGEEVETIEDDSTEESEMAIIEIPDNIDFKLNSSINKLIYDNIEIEKVKGVIHIVDASANMENVSLNMLQGQLKMDGQYSSKDILKPSIDFDMEMIDFDIQQTFQTFNTIKKLAPIAEKCQGKISMKFDIQSLLKQNMEPNLATVFSQGRLSSNSIRMENASVLEKLSGLLKTDKLKNITLANVDLNYKMENGVLKVEPFETKFGNSSVIISGSQNLDQSIAYKMNFTIPSAVLGSQANAVAQNLFSKLGQTGVNMKVPKNIRFGALVEGTLMNPEVKLDMKNQGGSMIDDLKEQAKQEIKKEVDKARGEAIMKAKQEAAKLIAEADKKSKQLVAEAQKTAEQLNATAAKNAELAKKEAYKQADNLVKEAGNDMIKKIVAEKAAKEIKSKADKSAEKAKGETAKRANGLVKEAKKKGDALKSTAKRKGDSIISKAEKK